MQSIALIAALLLIATSTASAQLKWTELPSGVGVWIAAVEFVDDTRGFAFADSAVALRTTDGGATWSRMNLGVSPDTMANWYIQRATFVSPSVGFVFGGENDPPYRARILRTTDAGNTWSLLPFDEPGTVQDVQVVNGIMAITGGEFRSPESGYVATTFDQGGDWSIKRYNDSAQPGVFHFSDNRDAIAAFLSTRKDVFGTYMLASTTDGGVSWTPLAPPLSPISPILEITHVADRTWLVGTVREGIIRTDDFGATWTPVSARVGYRFAFVDDSVGFAVSGPYGGGIARTTDGGVSWTESTEGLGRRALAVDAVSRDTAYVGDEEGGLFRVVVDASSRLVVERVRASALRLRQSPSGELVLGLEPAARARRYTIVDMRGRALLRGAIESGATRVDVATAGLPVGAYRIVVERASVPLIITR